MPALGLLAYRCTQAKQTLCKIENMIIKRIKSDYYKTSGGHRVKSRLKT
jgi:hypothetical protein